MIVIVAGLIFDDDKTPITLGFSGDRDRLRVAKHLIEMKPEQGMRLYSSYPESMNGIKIIEKDGDAAQHYFENPR